jgi:hypothetical protein
VGAGVGRRREDGDGDAEPVGEVGLVHVRESTVRRVNLSAARSLVVA